MAASQDAVEDGDGLVAPTDVNEGPGDLRELSVPKLEPKWSVALLCAEGAGALSLAAALTGQAGEGPIVCVVSGGNIDLGKFAELVTS